jgi:lipopolysaccharide export system permease protein
MYLMGNIISAYLAREILKTSAATIFILFAILMSNALGRILADIADGDVPQQALWPVLLSQSINILSLLLPIGVFLGVVFAFGRMYKDHEIVVMNACGVDYKDFYRPVLIVLLPLVLCSTYASLWLNPEVQNLAQSIVESKQNLHEFQQIKAGQFNQSTKGDQVFFMESISDDKRELRDIIISQSGGKEMVLETAKSGRQTIDEDSGDLFLVVGPGERFEGQAGSNEHRVIEFEEHGILIKKKNKSQGKQRRSAKSPTQLWNSSDLEDRVELHWRIAIPVLVMVLALLAVPLSYIAPRQGRFGKVGYALLLYIVYLNLMVVTRAQLEAGNFPVMINFWWVHILFLAMAAGLLWRRNRGIHWLRLMR